MMWLLSCSSLSWITLMFFFLTLPLVFIFFPFWRSLECVFNGCAPSILCSGPLFVYIFRICLIPCCCWSCVYLFFSFINSLHVHRDHQCHIRAGQAPGGRSKLEWPSMHGLCASEVVTIPSLLHHAEFHSCRSYPLRTARNDKDFSHHSSAGQRSHPHTD